jgi:phenylalanyl-tRNA synthetase beta chain
MKLPLPMLLDFVKTDIPAPELANLLTMTGFEVEDIEIVEGEPVLDVKVCSNRGDGLSALGLARELLAKLPDAEPTDLYIRAQARFPQKDESTFCEINVPVTI